jgi:hypothetical protein
MKLRIVLATPSSTYEEYPVPISEEAFQAEKPADCGPIAVVLA